MPNIRPLSPALAKIAQDELHEKPERIQDDIDALKAWLAKSSHIQSRTDDQFLVTFLRGCKYSLEKSKEKLDMYYTVRTALPELLLNRDPLNPKVMDVIRLGVGLVLPNTERPDTPRLILIRPGAYDPEKYAIEDIFKISVIGNDIAMREDDNFVVAGQVGILDMANVTMAHFLQYNPTIIKKFTMLGQEASPLRQKGFHYINTPPGFETVFNMFKSFMSEKNQSRLYIHGSNMDSLHQYVPKHLLPAEYGGDAGPIQDLIDNAEKKMISYRDYLIEEEKYGTIEKKRPGRPKNSDSLFGLEGSFRKLEVD